MSIACIARVAPCCRIALLLVGWLCAIDAWAIDLGRKIDFDVAPQPLASAVIEFSKQADIQVIAAGQKLEGVQSKGVKGRHAIEDGLKALLLGTGLGFKVVGDNTISLTAATTSELPTSPPERAAPAAEKLESIVVTGTNIRGPTSPASPTLVFSRDTIDQSGAATVQEFIQRLPQNFNGGANEATIGTIAGGGTAANRVGASGVNLRGLGNDATLVLIDGHRIAPGNVSGNFVDISMIPLAAVERIEIVPDGASAIYGSDAVGGVVNFIMRKDFDGAESRVAYRSGNSGHPDETILGQTFGRAWEGGNALLTYEYDDRSALFARDRGFTSDATDPTTLLPAQRRNSLFAAVNQAVNRDIELFAEGSYSQRATSSDFSTPAFSQYQPADIDAFSATLGGRARLSERLDFEASASYASSRTRQKVIDLGTGDVQIDNRTDTGIWSMDAKLEGTLWQLPTGPVRFAAGGQFRREVLDTKEVVEPVSSFRPTETLPRASWNCGCR